MSRARSPMTVPGPLARCGNACALALSTLILLTARPLDGQLISIKTVPIAQGDQFDIFPSQHRGMGGASIALADTLLDPFRNPATAARLAVPRLFASPTFYGVSKGTGGGRTLPLATFAQRGTWFGGLSLAVQEVDPSLPPASPNPIGFAEPGLRPVNQNPVPPSPPPQSHANAYAFALLGTTLAGPRLSLAASFSWARLKAVDGVEVLYPGNQGIDQFGHVVDMRLGLLKEWPGERSLDAVLLHNRFAMSQDVTYSDLFWDPSTQRALQRPRLDRELERTETWGLHLQYERPLAASGWRIGWIATGNLMSHPKMPDYEIMSIPRDPGHSHGSQLGIGVSPINGPGTQTNGFVLNDPAAFRAGGLLVAPNGPLTLEGVSVVTHQVSLSLPLH